MKDELFRKKALDKIKNPDDLNDYIHVSNPSIWLLLVSIIILLAGVFVWSFVGIIESSVPAAVSVENGKAVCYVEQNNLSSVQENMTVKFEEKEAVIISIGKKEKRGYSCALQLDEAVADGIYEGRIIIKTYKPISFVLN